MKVGVPKEVKNHEYRVAITPAGVHELVAQRARGLRRDRTPASARRSPTRSTSRPAPRSSPPPTTSGATGDLVLKVKEPIAEEYHRMREGQMLFTYLHLAADQAAAPRSCSSARSPASPTRPCSCPTGRCRCSPRCPRSPAGWRRRSARYSLMQAQGGRGVLMGGVSGVYARQGRRHRRRRLRHERRRHRARHAGRGDCCSTPNIDRLREADAIYQGHVPDRRVQRLRDRASRCIDADLVIGAVLVPGRQGARSWSPTSWSRG